MNDQKRLEGMSLPKGGDHAPTESATTTTTTTTTTSGSSAERIDGAVERAVERTEAEERAAAPPGYGVRAALPPPLISTAGYELW
jgi:hypothetical protein